MKESPKLLRKGFLYNNMGYDYTWFQNHETTADIIDTGETNQYHECFFKFIIVNNKITKMLMVGIILMVGMSVKLRMQLTK